MIDRMRRRKIIGVAAGAAALALAPAAGMMLKKKSSGEGEIRIEQVQPKKGLDVSKNAITQKELVAERTEAIDSLLNGLPRDPRLNYLHDRDRLEQESQAYLPDEAERLTVQLKSKKQLDELAAAIPSNGYGLFGFADMDESNTEYHRLYVLQKDAHETVRFVKAFRVTMAEKGFGNKKDSGQTPLGLRHVLSGRQGYYAEIVDVLPDKLPYFKTVVRDATGEHHFAKEFGNETGMEPAAVLTDRYTIDDARGIHFHASNRSGRWHLRNGKKVWVSNLGRRGSGACGRMASADVRNLGLRYIQKRVVKDGKVIEAGTPVYIHATPEVLKRSKYVAESNQDSNAQPDAIEKRPAYSDRQRERSRPTGGSNPFGTSTY